MFLIAEGAASMVGRTKPEIVAKAKTERTGIVLKGLSPLAV
jgi:hypothetical protein